MEENKIFGISYSHIVSKKILLGVKENKFPKKKSWYFQRSLGKKANSREA